LSALKSNAEIGVYSAGFKFFQTLLFFASSYTLSSTPKLARLADADFPSMVKKMKKDLLFLAVFGFSLAFGFYFLSPFVLGVLMKKIYGESLIVAQITVFALPFVLLSSVFFNVLYIVRKAKYVIYLFTFQLIFNFTLNRLLIPYFSFYASAWITVVSEVVNLIILVSITRKILRAQENEK
jgi:O-antigen/teichoic acid export membrane protein